MKQRDKTNLVRKVTTRFSESEYTQINTAFKGSTQRKLSEYIRNVLLHKPITMYTRNRSYDDFVAEMIILRSELHSIGNNINQAVKKLHGMEHIPAIKAWAETHEHQQQIMLKKMEEIKSKIGQLSGI